MMTKMAAGLAARVAGLAVVALISAAAAASAQQNIDAGSPAFFGGYSTFGGYYNTYGDFGGTYGNSGYGRYRRSDDRSPATTADTATVVILPFAGGEETSTHCRWLRGRANATHQRKWRERYAACLRDYSAK